MPNNNDNNRHKSNRDIPNISRNINGQNISFYDIDNMKKANAEMEKQMKYYERRAEALRNELKMSKELSKVDQERFDMYSKNLDNINNQLLKNDALLDEWPKKMRKMLANPDNKDKVIANLIGQSQANRNKIPRTIEEAFAYQLSQAQTREANNAYTKVAQQVYDKYKRKGADFTDSAVLKNVNKEIQEKTLTKIDGITNKYSTATSIFSAAANVFKSAVSVWWNVGKTGLNNQYNAFENSFENISVRNGVTRGQYYSAQSRTNNILGNLGLRNNIATSEVQNMWNTMASSGLRIDMSTEQARAEVTARAIDTVLTNKIVPYLDMSSSAAQQIADTNPNFLKQVRGIGVATTEIQGSSTFITKHLQELVDDIAPMATLAENELGLQFAQISGSYEYLRNTYNLNDAQIGALYKNTAAIYNNPYAALTGGSTDQRLAVALGLSNGIDFRDISQVDKYARYSTNYFANMVPEGNSSPLYGGMLASMGITGTDALTNAILNERNINMDEVTRAGLQVAANTNSAAERASQNYANDQNQTQTTLQDITLENFMNELAVGKQGLGHWTSVIVDAIKAIGTIITAKVIGGAIGKGIGALAGIGGAGLSSGTGLGAILGVGGPIALGIGAVAGTVAIINSKIAQQHTEKAEGTTNRIGNMYEQNKNAGMSDEANISDLWNSGQVSDDNGVFENGGETNASFSIREKLPNGHWYDKTTTFENFVNNDKVNFSTQSHAGGSMLEAFSWQSKELRESLGLTPDWLKSGYDEAKTALDKYGWGGERNAEAYNRIKTFALRSFLNQNQDIPFNYAMAALSAALVLGNHTNDTTITNPLTEYFGQAIVTDKDLLTKTLAANGITESKYLSAIYRILGDKNIDYWLMTNTGGVMTYPTDEQLKTEFNLHRYGLDTVPYDNYPALLHQGEAVLTASTANTLRNLLDEYQQTNTQAVNFDTIIQTQTNALISKMEEIIVVLTNNSGSNFTSTPEQTNARNILMNSMLHITSTKSF